MLFSNISIPSDMLLGVEPESYNFAMTNVNCQSNGTRYSTLRLRAVVGSVLKPEPKHFGSS